MIPRKSSTEEAGMPRFARSFLGAMIFAGPLLAQPRAAIFTVEQSQSGRAIYTRICSGCHGAEDRKDTSELQSPCNLVCRLLLEKKKKKDYWFESRKNKQLKITTLNTVFASY